MKKTALLCLLAGFLLATPSYSQEENDTTSPNAEESGNVKETDDHKRFWQASLPGGHYMVALDHISSISMHEYLLNQSLVVHEMVIDTNGRSLARFYHVVTIAENSASGTARRVLEKGTELLDRVGEKTGTDVKDMVQKDYPTTSHAGMVEYRVMSLPDLEAIYKSVKNAWETGRGRKITVK